jgi:hypothetical protein
MAEKARAHTEIVDQLKNNFVPGTSALLLQRTGLAGISGFGAFFRSP